MGGTFANLRHDGALQGTVAELWRSRRGSLLFLSILLLMIPAFLNAFVQDDAFISFRYARNLAEGMGLVWNPGERVEGYTNFLWTMIIAFFIYIGGDPVTVSLALGLSMYPLTLYLSFRLAERTLGSAGYALLVMVFLGANHTFSAYATGGLETQFLLLLLLAVSCLVLPDGLEMTDQRLASVSLLLVAMVMTRPDSALFAAVMMVAAVRKRRISAGLAGGLLSLALPFALVVGAWLSWKLSYYGDIFPNTFHAKYPTADSARNGFYYIYIFLFSYWLFPFPLMFAASLPSFVRRSGSGLRVMAVFLLLWTAYLVKIGGDVLEFRFMVPVLPFFFIIAAWLMREMINRAEVRAALAALVILGSLNHSLTFGRYTYPNLINSIAGLREAVIEPPHDWRGAGTALGSGVGFDPTVTIATTAAGAIPYYSRLSTVDMHGLNDAWIARNGDIVGSRAGHQRLAPLSYLVERGVNLVIGHPMLKGKSLKHDYTKGDMKKFFRRETELEELPPPHRVVEIPVGEEWVLVAYYLKEHPSVERAVAENGWKLLEIGESGGI